MAKNKEYKGFIPPELRQAQDKVLAKDHEKNENNETHSKHSKKTKDGENDPEEVDAAKKEYEAVKNEVEKVKKRI